MKRELPVAGGGDVRAFIARLAERLPPPADAPGLPGVDCAALVAVQREADLPGIFAKAAEAAGCSVQRVKGDEWVGAVVAAISKNSAQRVVLEINPETLVCGAAGEALRAALTAAGVEVTAAVDDETLFTVDAAVTGVPVAIAETGTLVCPTGPLATRGATLIPPVHVAVVAALDLVPDLFDGVAAAGKYLGESASIHFITGPSKTADIEGILVRGVHGPGQVAIVLVE